MSESEESAHVRVGSGSGVSILSRQIEFSYVDTNFKLVSDTSESVYSECADRDRNSRVPLSSIHHLSSVECAFCAAIFLCKCLFEFRFFLEWFV